MATYEFEHSVETTASPEAVWVLWSDVSRWTEWDSGLESVVLDGPFEVGVNGTMVVPGRPPVPFTLTEVRPGKGFVDVSEIPGALLRFHHTLEPLDGGRVRVTHGVVIEGPAAREIGPFVTADLPDAVKALVELASSAP